MKTLPVEPVVFTGPRSAPVSCPGKGTLRAAKTASTGGGVDSGPVSGKRMKPTAMDQPMPFGLPDPGGNDQVEPVRQP